jgi:adenine-specific DNA methylase
VSVLVRKDLNIEPLETLDSSEFTLANLDTAQRLERQQRFLPDLQVLTMDTPSVNGYAVSNDWFNVLPGT